MNKVKRFNYSKAIKITYVILMIFMVLSCTSRVFASISPGDLTGGGFGQQEEIKGLGNKIIGMISTVGIVISVLVLVILGIKYMIGSASEKAEYKKTMIPYLVGAILVFAASGIAQIVMNISKDFAGGEG